MVMMVRQYLMVGPKVVDKAMVHNSTQADMIKEIRDIAEPQMRSKGGFNVGVEKHMGQRVA